MHRLFPSHFMRNTKEIKWQEQDFKFIAQTTENCRCSISKLILTSCNYRAVFIKYQIQVLIIQVLLNYYMFYSYSSLGNYLKLGIYGIK